MTLLAPVTSHCPCINAEVVLMMTVFTHNASFLICVCSCVLAWPVCQHSAVCICMLQVAVSHDSLMAVQAALLDYAQSEVELRTARDSKRFNLASTPLNEIVTHLCRPVEHVKQVQCLSNPLAKLVSCLNMHDFVSQLLLLFCVKLTGLSLGLGIHHGRSRMRQVILCAHNVLCV